jgi:hypothetical protein
MLAFMGIFDIIGTTLSGWLSDRWDSRGLLGDSTALKRLRSLPCPWIQLMKEIWQIQDFLN